MAEFRPHLPASLLSGSGEANVALAIIGSGWPAAAQSFRELMELPALPVYCDKGRRAFDAAGLERGVLRTFNPLTLVHYLQAMWHGQRQGKLSGDPWQQGGVLVVGTDGEIAFRQASRWAGDHPAPARVIEALRALARR